MISSVPIHAFTTKSTSGLLNRLINQVTIAYGKNSISAKALWDTGATSTCISVEMATRLALVPTGIRNIMTPSGSSTVNTYLVDIILPNNVCVKDVEVCDSAIGSQGIGVLIGMDIITKGDFSVSNHNGQTVFSFRIPSTKTTDYVEILRTKSIIGTHGKGMRKFKK